MTPLRVHYERACAPGALERLTPGATGEWAGVRFVINPPADVPGVRVVVNAGGHQHFRMTPTSTPRMLTFSFAGSTRIGSIVVLHGSRRTWSFRL